MQRLLLVGILTFTITPPARAQLGTATERYELGRRLKAFEAAWEKHDEEAGRKRALALLPQVTTQFFTGRLGEAGRTLDLAAFALQTDVAPSVVRQLSWALYPEPETRVVDGSAKELTVTIQAFYPIKGELPKNLELQLWFTEKQVVRVKPDKFPVTVKVPLPPLGESRGLDRKLYLLVDGARELRPVTVGVSQIADLRSRLDKLTDALKTKPETPATMEEVTASRRAATVGLATGGNKGPSFPPTDIPYAELLANAETMLDGKPFFSPEKAGQFWLSVPTAAGVADCRVYIPKGLDKSKPVPVVFGLHGAGVDENMFFESYGAGQIVRECEKRGWVLVCPRAGTAFGGGVPVMAMFDVLSKRYPLDPNSIFVVGHSMGAMQAAGQVAAGKFAGIALLGGGSRPGNLKAFANLPTFIGVGDKDSLALSGARGLNKALTESGAKRVTYKEYPDVEHLVIVREALPEAFAVFDTALQK